MADTLALVPNAIVEVTGDPTLSFVSGAAGGVALHAQLFSGSCRIEGGAAKLFGTIAATQLGFYLPQAGPFRPSHLLSAWGEVVPARMHVEGGQATKTGPYGVDAVSVELVDDSRGSGSMWPYVWMTVWGGAPMLLRYRVTVTQPLENA